STGEVDYWVQVPTVSHSAGTVFYILYGNASVTTDQSNKTGVWDGNFVGVWHLGNGTTLDASDSTSNADNGTISSASVTTGEVDGGANFSASGQISIPASTPFTSGSFTVSLWADFIII